MKGIIAEVKNKRAIFLSKSGGFYTIYNKNYKIGESVEYLPRIYYPSILAYFIVLLFCGFNDYKNPASNKPQ